MEIKREDHARYQDMLNDGRYDNAVRVLMDMDAQMGDLGDTYFDDAVFVMTYLKKLRKGVYESIFESLRNHVPPLVALAGVLGVLGVKEDDIDGAFGMKTSAVSGLYVPGRE
jgi:hypothetical protein